MQVVPIALRQQAVEAGRTKDKAVAASVGELLPAASQVKRGASCLLILLVCFVRDQLVAFLAAGRAARFCHAVCMGAHAAGGRGASSQEPIFPFVRQLAGRVVRGCSRS